MAKYQVIAGLVSRVSSSSSTTGMTINGQVTVATSHLQRFRVNNRPVIFNYRSFDVADGEHVTVVGKDKPEFHAVAADFQVSIPQLGTITARQRPIVVATSNAQRKLTDALRGRCFLLWMDYPTPELEATIITRSRQSEPPLKVRWLGLHYAPVHEPQREHLHFTAASLSALQGA